MNVDFVDYEDIGMLHPITRAYINNDPKIQSLFQYGPSAKGLKEAIDNRNKFKCLQYQSNLVISMC